MGSKLVNRGLQVIGGRASSTADSFAAIQSMAWDDKTGAIGATDTTLGSPSNVFAANFDSTPTRSGQTVSHLGTIPAGSFGGNTIRRITLHNAAAASVNGTSPTLIGGIDQQSFLKTTDFSLTNQLDITYTTT